MLLARLSILTLSITLVCCAPADAPAQRPPSPPSVAEQPSGVVVATATNKEDVPPERATGFRVLAGVRAERHMVAAANPHASTAGLAILEAGGSAVDAAVAMALVLTLVEPQSSGIGGGAFLLHWKASAHELSAYDGRETAPAKASGDMFLSAGKPRDFMDAVVGGLSVGVPGELRMLELAHREHGKLAWKALFEPAIRLAEQGFSMSPRLYELLAWDKQLAAMPAAKGYFYGDDGAPRPVGSSLKNPELAEVLRQVAQGGADAFYRGAIAADIVRAVTRAPKSPGRLALADLERYQAKKRGPLCRPYRRYRVCGMPPPTSGGVAALQILGLLERFDLPSMDPRSVALTHLFAEASRLAFADRDVYLADPDFVSVPVERLLDPTYLAARSKLVDAARSMGTASAGQPDGRGAHYGGDASLELPSTSHLVVVDAQGNAVSMTASIESAFGSRLFVRGFLLNNELTDFSFVPERDGRPVANRVEPGKRPRSSMTPLLVLDEHGEQFVLAVGSPGGSRIIGYVTRAAMMVLDFKLDPQSVFALPHVINRNGVTELEDVPGERGWLSATKSGLEALGHKVEIGEQASGLHAILRLPDGTLLGAADPRREGRALGR